MQNKRMDGNPYFLIFFALDFAVVFFRVTPSDHYYHHDLAQAERLADRLLFMRNGTIIESGM
jgi:ABC-type phosphonate transport system ATPase subunit